MFILWERVGTSTIRMSTGQKFQNVEMVFLVDQNVEIRTSKMSFELIRTSKSELSQRRKANYQELITTTKITTSKRMKRASKVSFLSDFHILTTYGVF